MTDKERDVICSIMDKLTHEGVLAVITFANTMYHTNEKKEGKK